MSELLRDLNKEVFSAKPEAVVHALLKDLNREAFSAKLETGLSEAVLATLVSQPGVTRSLADESVVSVNDVVAVLPEYCQATQYSTLKNARLLNWGCEAVV